MSKKMTSQPQFDEDSFSIEVKKEVIVRPPRKDVAAKAVMDGIIDSSGIEARLPDIIVDYIEKLMQRDGVDIYGSDGFDYSKSELGRYYLRGVFLACGYVSDPSLRYRIELHIKNPETKPVVEALLSRDGLEYAVSSKDSSNIIYLRKGDSVSDFLGIIGANGSRLNFENIRAEREIIGNVTRSMNFDSGNTKRQADAGAVRNKLITKLMNSDEASNLTPELRMAAEVNLANPGASISELGKLMDPPIGKSGMNHRIQKLLEIAKSLD